MSISINRPPVPRPQGNEATVEELRADWSDSTLTGKDDAAVSALGETRTLIVRLTGEGNFHKIDASSASAQEKRDASINELLRVNERSLGQAAPTLEALKGADLIAGIEVMPLSNTLLVEVPVDRAADAFAALHDVPGVGQVETDRTVTLDPAERESVAREMGTGSAAPEDGPRVEWNVEKVGAPALWEEGVRGEGVTVGVVDTGVDVDHPALKSKYRGTGDDGKLDNAYNFFDAVSGEKKPYDDNHHGTHVAGTVLGSTEDGVTGMAPDAKWIAAKILDADGSGATSDIIRALEWMIAPRDASGKNPDATKAPDIISNSWGIGDPRYDGFRNVWSALQESGITVVTAAGNRGPSRGSLDAPGSYHNGITVGATDSSDKIASFSGRGPSPWRVGDNESYVPDVSAPGKAVRSSIPGGGYDTFSGTSMATPGVSGVAALLLSKFPELTNIDVNIALAAGAKDLGPEGYDDSYGFGRIDAEAALVQAQAIMDEKNEGQTPTPSE